MAIAAGTSASSVFTTRMVDAPAGVAEVTVTGAVGGEQVSTVVQAPYAAHNCG